MCVCVHVCLLFVFVCGLLTGVQSRLDCDWRCISCWLSPRGSGAVSLACVEDLEAQIQQYLDGLKEKWEAGHISYKSVKSVEYCTNILELAASATG